MRGPRRDRRVSAKWLASGVEMSDVGLMAEDIEGCMNVVLEALRKCDLPAAEVIAWCSAMLENDRVGFIAREPLQ